MEPLLPFTDDLVSLLPQSLASSNHRLVDLLEATPDVSMKDGHRGTLRAGKWQARLTIESEQWIGVHLPLGEVSFERDVLQSAHQLPGNLRFATSGKGLALHAETRIDGIDHLPESLGEISAGLRLARSRRKTRRGPPADLPERGAVHDALGCAREALDLEADSLIETGGGWELRLHHEGRVFAVQATVEAGGLRFTHAIARVDQSIPAPLLAEVLRWNAHIRFARIVATEGNLVVETRLRSAQAIGEWIALACRAVAVVTGRVREPLRLLAADARVSKAYAAVFPSRLQLHAKEVH
jgi:hypothetical protein